MIAPGWTFRSLVLLLLGCTPTVPNELDKLGTVPMTIKGQSFELWIADEWEEQQKGLMFVTREQMAPLPDGKRRGMIFVFEGSQTGSFWMKNTIIPLDIAYVGADRKVVRTYTMAALDERSNRYPPGGEYRFAIEVNSGTWSELGLTEGDALDIPPSVVVRRK